MNNDKDNATLYAELKAERFMTDQISLLHEAEDLADGINFMLKSIGEFTDADRAYVFETSENHTSTNTYEWCAAGVTPQYDCISTESRKNYIIKRSCIICPEDRTEYASPDSVDR